jgi:hypothetical protein
MDTQDHREHTRLGMKRVIKIVESRPARRDASRSVIKVSLHRLYAVVTAVVM